MWLKNIPKHENCIHKDWLVKPLILSQAMKKICNQLSVNLLSQQQEKILEHEQTFLKLENKINNTWVRKVILLGDNTPWEYARVIIPNTTYNSYRNEFESLGGKLIGENLLYNNPKTTRSKFEYINVSINSYIYNEIKAYLLEYEIDLQNISLWGRRSIFYIDGIHKILISEFFLPDIPDYPHN